MEADGWTSGAGKPPTSRRSSILVGFAIKHRQVSLVQQEFDMAESRGRANM